MEYNVYEGERMKAMKDEALRLMFKRVRASKMMNIYYLCYVIMNDDRSWMLPPWRA